MVNKGLSFKNKLTKNSSFVNKVLVQNDQRYYNPYFIDIVAYFLTKEAVIPGEQQIIDLKEPDDKELKIVNNPQKLEKYIALKMLKKEDFSDSEIFFERSFGNDKPDVAALGKEKQIFVECSSCRVDKVLNYLAHNRELWILTDGAYPWDKKPLSEPMQLFTFKRGPAWEAVFQEYQRKRKQAIKQEIKGFDNFLNL